MAILNKGHDFSDGDQVTAAKLDSAVDSATFAAGSVDNASTQLSGGAIVIKDSGVTAAKLASNAVTTSKILDANVTTSKIADDSVTTSKILDANITLSKLATELKNALYPIGSIYTNATNATNPSSLIGFGTWVAFSNGKVIVGIDSGDVDFDTVGETGGAKTHTLTTLEIPSHSHNYTRKGPTTGGTLAGGDANSVGQFTDSTSLTGGGQAHNNLQPYIVVYMWKRTA